jgi:hypothetical protein
MNGISGAASAVQSNGVDNQTNVTRIEKKGMALIVGKRNLNDTQDGPTKFETESGPSISMPAFSNITSNSTMPTGIQTKMIVSATNPLQGTSGSQTKGTILSLDLADEFGRELVVNNTKEPFRLLIPAQQPARSFWAKISLFGFTYFKVWEKFYCLKKI